jgi:outer membrane protein OmpA-like peptidoglycan-associated protein
MAEHEKTEKHEEGHGGGSHGGGGHGGGGHGGGEHEEHEGAPEWLISFADNVALMMGFFVILLAMNMKKETAGGIGGEKAMGGRPSNEMADFVLAMREGFNNPVNVNSTNPAEADLVKRKREKESESNEAGRKGKNEKVQSVRPHSDFSNLGGQATFVEGSAALSETEKAGVKRIAETVAGLRWMVEVRGHVSAAESVRDPRAGWRMSFDRAYAAGQALVEGGMDWKQIRLVACGTNGSMASGRQYDSTMLRGDQRAEIVVTNEPMPDAH